MLCVRTYDELLAMGSEHGGGGLSDAMNLLVMPIVHGPSVANFEKPVRLRFFAGDLNDLKQDVMMEERNASQAAGHDPNIS